MSLDFYGENTPTTREIKGALRVRAAELAVTLLGEPNRKLSTPRQLRFGARGSVSVEIAGRKAGLFFDHETGEGGNLFDLIRRELGFARFGEVLHWAANWLGSTAFKPAAEQRLRPDFEEHDCGRLHQFALKIWEDAVPIAGTPGETYLRTRGLYLPQDVIASDVLRFHASTPRGGERLPAMIALMRDVVTDEPLGIHRTFILPDGSAKIDNGPAKMMLGPVGAGAIKLVSECDLRGELGIAEGIENALTAIIAGGGPTWACGSARALGRFPIVPQIKRLNVYADHDNSGAGIAAARRTAAHWSEAGIGVHIITPLGVGTDLNDLLLLVRGTAA